MKMRLQNTPLPFPHHYPVIGICGKSESERIALVVSLVTQLVRRGLRVAVVVSDGKVADTPYHEHPLFSAGSDVVVSDGEDIQCFYHQSGEGDLVALIHREIQHYDLFLIVGEGRTSEEKIWLLSEQEKTPPVEVNNIVKVIPFQKNEARILDFLDGWLFQTWRKTPLWGCVLIGGKSSRMGRPKHLIKDARGVSWLERTVQLMQRYTDDIVLSGQGEVPESLGHLIRLPDIPGIAGPLTGILSAMRWQPAHSWLLAACDMPNIKDEALQWLLDKRCPGSWATVPSQGEAEYLEPLLAHYDFRSAPLCEALLVSGSLRIGTLARNKKVATPVIPAHIRDSWSNFNTPEQLPKNTKLCSDCDSATGTGLT